MIKDELEKLGIPTFKYIDGKQQELKDQFIEMAQLKSDFDIEKFTVRKEGSFIAHNFHFLMRQYSLALQEMKKMLLEKEHKRRKVEECEYLLENNIQEKVFYIGDHKEEKYIDLYRDELLNQIDSLELSIVNKACMIRGFEACRLKLIEINGGKAPTNEEYQKEEPEYWKWFLAKNALENRRQATTGIPAGIWMNIQHLEEPAVINPEYQVKMLNESGNINLKQILDETEAKLLE